MQNYLQCQNSSEQLCSKGWDNHGKKSQEILNNDNVLFFCPDVWVHGMSTCDNLLGGYIMTYTFVHVCV